MIGYCSLAQFSYTVQRTFSICCSQPFILRTSFLNHPYFLYANSQHPLPNKSIMCAVWRTFCVMFWVDARSRDTKIGYGRTYNFCPAHSPGEYAGQNFGEQHNRPRLRWFPVWISLVSCENFASFQGIVGRQTSACCSVNSAQNISVLQWTLAIRLQATQNLC